MPEAAAAATGRDPETESMPTMGFLDHLEDGRQLFLVRGAILDIDFRDRIGGDLALCVQDAAGANAQNEVGRCQKLFRRR